jgi:protein deglycase
VQALRADGRPAKLARQYFQAGKPVAAICAAPAVLKDANLLENRKFTAHFSVYEELPNALAQERVVQDGSILTGRGAGTAVDFGLAVVRTLFGADKAHEIARSIMA